MSGQVGASTIFKKGVNKLEVCAEIQMPNTNGNLLGHLLQIFRYERVPYLYLCTIFL